MITANVLSRTFHIKYGQSIGTCFTVDIENRQYFVTAKHVVKNLKDGDTISIFRNGNWQNAEAILTGHSAVADVTVFTLNVIIHGHNLPAKTVGLIYGQDLYFLGFPFGLRSEIGELNRDFPLPLVKKAVLSLLVMDQPGKYLLLDGHNNPGFSGGPVVFKEPNSNDFNVCGIISSYRYELVETIINGNPTPIQAKANTGIIIAYTIDNALELIKVNPNGRQF